MSEINPVAFGRLEAKVETLEVLVAEQTKTLERMAERLDAMNELLSQARGGWRTLMWAGGAMAGLGSAITWAVQHIVIKP